MQTMVPWKLDAVPLMGTYDVIILGGGTAGSLAGVSSARQGLRTLIIEQLGCLGGSATAGLVLPLMTSGIPGNDTHCALGNEISRRLRENGGMEMDDHYFDPVLLKCVLEDMVQESGCELLYHTMTLQAIKQEACLTHVVVANKDGIMAYKGRYFVDATGDADVAYMAGVPCESGDAQGVNQPVSLRFEMGNVDFNAFYDFNEKLGYQRRKYFAMNTPGMKGLLAKAEAEGVLTAQDIGYFQAFGVPGKPHCMNFNCPELTTKKNVVDAGFLTQKQIEGKRAILRLRAFLRKYVPGFENAYITEIAELVGFRESRRIKAEYTMTIHDIMAYRKFEDAVIASNYPVDVHGYEDVSMGTTYDEAIPADQKYWEVPFRTMVPLGIDNMLVAGRCGGFDFLAQSATRVQLICRAMGEACGYGLALAAQKGCALRDIDHNEVSRKMGLRK